MANTRYEYVKQFEEMDPCMPSTFMVVRIDGRGFTKFCKLHEFKKPNDIRALELMNACAIKVAQDFPDILLAFGESDEYSFMFSKNAKVFNRRRAKICSSIVSLFSAAYVFLWKDYMGGDTPLRQIPQFDARLVLYPSEDIVRDYFRWRQADCHINNLYNTTLWTLILKGNATEKDATEELRGTLSKDKNEILFSRFGINYNAEPEIFRKGSVILKFDPSAENETKLPAKVYHVDIMKEKFWNRLFAI